MSSLFLFCILCAILTNTVLGIGVYLNNRERQANVQFLTITIVISLWLVCQCNALLTTEETWVIFWIKQAHVASGLIPIAFILLLNGIRHPLASLQAIYGKSRIWILLNLPFAILCQTPFFLDRLAPESAAKIHVPDYGLGIIIYTIYFIGAIVCVVHKYSSARKKAHGIQQAELEFIMLGFGCGLTFGALAGLIIPTLTPYTDAVQFTPLSIIVMNGLVAYGIATHRIMGVENVLRTIVAYMLLGAYLIGIYLVVRTGSGWLFDRFMDNPQPLAELLSALVVAFSVAPMHGQFQKVARSLFLNWRSADIQHSASSASSILQSISTVDELMERFGTLVSETFGTDSIRIYIQQTEERLGLVYSTASSQPEEIDTRDPLVEHCRHWREAAAADLIKRSPPPRLESGLLPAMQSKKAAAVVGLRSKSMLDGILLVGSRLSGRIYGQSELKALEVLASQLGVALENARLYTEVQNSKIYNEILLDNMVSGVIAADRNGRITVFNREAQRMTGLHGNSFLQEAITTLPEELAEPLSSTLQRQTRLRDIEVTLPSQQGESLPIRIGTGVFHDLEGEFLGGLLVFSDLSHIRKLEQQIRRTDRLTSLGTLSAGMAHEIKNPLVSIKTFTDLLPERYDDSDFRDTFSELVSHEVSRIDTIVNQLLKFSRPSEPQFTPIDLHDIVERCFRLVSQQLRTSRIQTELRLDAALSQIEGDPDQLEQVLVNFILNAIQAMPEGGTLTVRTELTEPSRQLSMPWNATSTGPRVMIRIEDTGKGIAPEHLGRIFDPFFTTKDGGTGMGLAVTHNILETHHALVDVDSALHQGTTFILSFPVLDAEVAAE